VTDTRLKRVSFNKKDVAEIATGACIMAFPVAVTEEVWNLGTELSLPHVLFFALASIFFLALMVYMLQHKSLGPDRKVFLRRVLSTYFITLFIAALLLIGVDRLELFTEPAVGLKRAILVAFPASFAATMVDNFGS